MRASVAVEGRGSGHRSDAWIDYGARCARGINGDRETYFQQPSVAAREGSALGRATPARVHRTSFPLIVVRHVRLWEGGEHRIS